MSAVCADGPEMPPVPMLAAAIDELPAPSALPGGLAFEPKWDGFRGMASRDDAGRVAITSRQGRDLTNYFPDIVQAVRAQLVGDVVLDGELVVWAGGRLDFGSLQRRLVAGRRLAELVAAEPGSYVVFDVLAVGGVDWMPRPWLERRAQLEQLLAATRPPLQLCPATTDRDRAVEWFETWAPLGVEGLLVKGQTQAYLPGRRGWLKVRHRHSAEAVVGAVVGPLAAPQRLVLGAFDDGGRLRVVGSTGTLRADAAREVGALLAPPAAGHPWPSTLPSSVLAGLPGQRPAKVVTLAEPAVVVEVVVDTAFEAGRFRHLTRYGRVRPDVEPAEVTVAGLVG